MLRKYFVFTQVLVKSYEMFGKYSRKFCDLPWKLCLILYLDTLRLTCWLCFAPVSHPKSESQIVKVQSDRIFGSIFQTSNFSAIQRQSQAHYINIDLHKFGISLPCSAIYFFYVQDLGMYGTIHILCQHIFGPFLTHPLCQHKYSTECQQKWPFPKPKHPVHMLT